MSEKCEENERKNYFSSNEVFTSKTRSQFRLLHAKKKQKSLKRSQKFVWKFK